MSNDDTEDLNLPTLSKSDCSGKSNTIDYGTYKGASDSKSHVAKNKSTREDKLCKALTGDCNCAHCYDASGGFIWG